jgi:YrbI family 3-deoxy-D-manno-octulosonate 8-phosphate phosphatase
VTRIAVTELDLAVYDFDGVMTDNRVYVMQDGTEAVACTRADGLGVDMIRAMGVPQLILSTETNPVVQTRAAKLGLEAISGAADKCRALLEICASRRYAPARVLYVGNDVNDLEAMRAVGYPVSPADGHPAVRAIARVITRAAGGQGVVRELAGEILTREPDAPAVAADKVAPAAEQIRQELAETAALCRRMMDDPGVLGRVEAMARAIAASLDAGGKVIFAGNGGSFADAQHLAAEFVGRFMKERAPLAGVCLGANGSSVTAIANDYRFEEVFARELRALGRTQDVFVALSTSGGSANLVAAIGVAREIGMQVFALLGKGGGRIAALVPNVLVPSGHTARVQELHITPGHVLCGLVESMVAEHGT